MSGQDRRHQARGDNTPRIMDAGQRVIPDLATSTPIIEGTKKVTGA